MGSRTLRRSLSEENAESNIGGRPSPEIIGTLSKTRYSRISAADIAIESHIPYPLRITPPYSPRPSSRPVGRALSDQPAYLAYDKTRDNEATEQQHHEHHHEAVGTPSQKPKDNPVLNENFERFVGPANSVPTPTSQAMRGVSWYLRPTSVPTVVGSP